jgi:hypothetical protein
MALTFARYKLALGSRGTYCRVVGRNFLMALADVDGGLVELSSLQATRPFRRGWGRPWLPISLDTPSYGHALPPRPRTETDTIWYRFRTGGDWVAKPIEIAPQPN